VIGAKKKGRRKKIRSLLHHEGVDVPQSVGVETSKAHKKEGEGMRFDAAQKRSPVCAWNGSDMKKELK